MTTVEKSGTDAGSDPEGTGIRVLGYTDKIPHASREFRLDGRLRVPAGVRITQVESTFNMDRADLYPAKQLLRGQGGHGAEGANYEIVDLAMQGDETDVITFTLRNGLNYLNMPAPEGKRSLTVRITLTNGKVEIQPVAQVFSTLPRPWPVVPGPHQAQFGYVSDDGRIPAGTFPVRIHNADEGREEAKGNHTDHVYYQLVHEDGTPSNLTPVPVKQPIKGTAGLAEADLAKVEWAVQELNLREAKDKHGYYRFLVWPQVNDGPGGPVNEKLSWDRTKIEEGWFLGSVYYRYHATSDGVSHDGHKESGQSKADGLKGETGTVDEHQLAIFQVRDAIPQVTVGKGEEDKKNPGHFILIAMTSADEQPVSIGKLRQEFHAPKGLVFTGIAGYAYFDHLRDWQQTKPTLLPGSLEDDGKTLIVEAPLHLFTGAQDRPFLGYGLAVAAEDGATPGTYDDGYAVFGKHHGKVKLTGTVLKP
ncbi:hypothetical protein [Streptomyces sp. NPDC057002]|uniref:hypothetical protein n=1 Tax=Streptomyces sp. NPDC057002 TaxID=3345992 RepID=UPI00362B87FB